jgi:hypothetical protein
MRERERGNRDRRPAHRPPAGSGTDRQRHYRIASPFFSRGYTTEAERDHGSVLIEDSRFRKYFGGGATAYTAQAAGEQPLKQAVVRGSTFEPLTGVPINESSPPAAISMNYRMAPGDPEPREPVVVYDFNGKAGDSFKVYYSLAAPADVAPCQDSRRDIGGWVCQQ